MNAHLKKNWVTVGVPVYNGQKYLDACLGSLVRQTYPKIEIIISDNCSTDNTAFICQKYARQFSHVRYIRNYNNVGAVKNFNKLLEVAQCEYFMWAAFDDLWDSRYISRCVEKLKASPCLIGCTTSLRFIDKNSDVIDSVNYEVYDNLDLSNTNVASRISRWMNRWGWHSIYGVYRTSEVNSIKIEDRYGSDVLFILQVLMKGGIFNIPETLFYYRITDKTEQDRYLSQGAEKSSDKQLNFCHTQLALTAIDTIWKSPLVREEEKTISRQLLLETLLKSNIWKWRFKNDMKGASFRDLKKFLVEENISLFNDVDRKTKVCCCLIEQNPCHEFMLPSIVYALNQLGIHVDVYLNPHAIERDPFFYTKNLEYNLYSTESAEFLFLRNILQYSAYDLVFFNSLDNFVQNTKIPNVVSEIKNYLSTTPVVGVAHYIKKIEQGQEQHDITLYKERVQIFTINYCLSRQSQYLPDDNWINPIYYCDSIQKIRTDCKLSKEITFVVQGNLEFNRRNYIGLLDVVQDVLSKTSFPFKIKIVGQSHLPDGLKFKRQVQSRGLTPYFNFVETNSSFEVFYREIVSADYILFLIDKTSDSWSVYYNHIVSSSVPTSIALGVIPILHDELSHRYHLHGITYPSGYLNEAMIEAIAIYNTKTFWEYKLQLECQAKYLRLVNTYNLAKALDRMGFNMSDKIKLLESEVIDQSKGNIKLFPYSHLPYSYLRKLSKSRRITFF